MPGADVAWGRGADRARYRRLFLLDAALLVVVAFLSSALTLDWDRMKGTRDHDEMVDDITRCSMTLGQPGATFGAAFIADPGTPGTNRLLVSGVPAGVQGVTVELLHLYTGGSPLSSAADPGRRRLGGRGPVLPFTGDWTVTALVRVDTFTEARGTCDFTIAP